MSNLEELSERLCPDGVEAVELGQVAHYAKNRIDADAVTENTYVGVENLLQNKAGKTVAVSVPTKGTVIAFNPNDILIGNIRPYLKKIWLSDCAGGTNGDVLVIQIDERERLLPKYLFYVLSSDRFFLYDMQNSKGAKMPRGNKAAILKYRIPVPPLPVQGEIVRILDNFAIATTEIQQKLQEELAARQKQYEYYRDLLLTFKANESTILNELELSGAIRWMKLGDTCVLKAGKAISAAEISPNVNDDYIYPCYGGNGLRGYVKNYNQDGEHPIVGRQGALCGNVCYACNKFYATEHAVVVSPSALYNEKFLYYLLDFARLEQYKTAGAQPGLSVARLEKVVLPVPPLEVQKRIVDILDRFDAFCNDISSGLPAEIEMRQKQYEYYRDKLLTFKELKKEA